MKVREALLDFDSDIPRHWLAGSPAVTHSFNAFSALIPGGERFFIRHVAHFRKYVTDPGEREGVALFIGQEAQHSRSHEAHVNLLKAQGYPARAITLSSELTMRRFDQLFSPKLCLAITAGMEHYTAVRAEVDFSFGIFDRAHPQIADMYYWHGAEEMEHKSVAYDILQHVAPRRYFLRIFGFLLGVTLLEIFIRYHTRKFIACDSLSRAELRADREKIRSWWPAANRAKWRALARYLKPGFHPTQTDTSTLATKFLQKRFG